MSHSPCTRSPKNATNTAHRVAAPKAPRKEVTLFEARWKWPSPTWVFFEEKWACFEATRIAQVSIPDLSTTQRFLRRQSKNRNWARLSEPVSQLINYVAKGCTGSWHLSESVVRRCASGILGPWRNLAGQPSGQYKNISSGAVSMMYSVIMTETNGGWFSATMSCFPKKKKVPRWL